MGAFFTNIQLKTSGADKTTFTNKVIECLIKINAEQGFIKVDDKGEADKTVIVSLSDNTEWLSVYDEELEDQNLKNLKKLSTQLSKQLKTPALSVLVNDSDSMYVGLNIDGKLKDSLSNLSDEIDFTKMKPDSWEPILLNKYSSKDIKKSWQANDILVEGFLAEFAKFINIDASKLLTGYNYLNKEKPNEGIQLNFAQKDKKKAAEPGLTKFDMVAGTGLEKIKCGKRQSTQWIMTNLGTFSNGLDIIISGECITQDLFVPEIVKASYVTYESDNQNEFTASFKETISTTGVKIYYARIDEIYIPKGFQPTYPMTPKEGKRYLKIQYDSAIKFDINFIAKNTGNGDLAIYFSPLVNRGEGYYCAELKVKVIK